MIDVTEHIIIFWSPGWVDLLDKVAGGHLHHGEELLQQEARQSQ